MFTVAINEQPTPLLPREKNAARNAPTGLTTVLSADTPFGELILCTQEAGPFEVAYISGSFSEDIRLQLIKTNPQPTLWLNLSTFILQLADETEVILGERQFVLRSAGSASWSFSLNRGGIYIFYLLSFPTSWLRQKVPLYAPLTNLYVYSLGGTPYTSKTITASLNTQQGFTILLEAANGQDLIERLESNSQLPDLCLLDIDMPVMDGYETAQYLRQRYPAMKILAFTLFINKTKEERILEAGADSVLPKESDPLQWKEALLMVYHQHR